MWKTKYETEREENQRLRDAIRKYGALSPTENVNEANYEIQIKVEMEAPIQPDPLCVKQEPIDIDDRTIKEEFAEMNNTKPTGPIAVTSISPTITSGTPYRKFWPPANGTIMRSCQFYSFFLLSQLSRVRYVVIN